jgi:hypothetical protein
MTVKSSASSVTVARRQAKAFMIAGVLVLIVSAPCASFARGGAAGAGAAGPGGGQGGVGASARAGGAAVGGGAPAGAVGGGAPAGSVGGGAPAYAGGIAGGSTGAIGSATTRGVLGGYSGGVLGGYTGVGNPTGGNPELGGRAPPATEQSSSTTPEAVRGVAELPVGPQTGLATTAADGVSTKIVAARPCSTAARETDGTTTCIGIPEESATAERRR